MEGKTIVDRREGHGRSADGGCEEASEEAKTVDAVREKEESDDKRESIDSEAEHNAPKDPPQEQASTTDIEKANLSLQRTTSAPLYTTFTSREKVWIVFMSTLGAFISPLSTNIYFPALPTLAAYYHRSIADLNLTLTTYMVFQAVAPMFFSDAAETHGHRPPMIAAYVIYFAANIGCATQTSYPALLVLRCLQSLGSSGTVAIRMAVISAVITPAERGRYMSWAQVGVLMAPTLAPVLGGVLAQLLGWRAIFWFLVIVSGLYLVVYIIAMPETHRGIVGDGSVRPQRWWNRSALDTWRKDRLTGATHPDVDKRKTRSRFPNPIKSLRLFREPDIAILLVFGMFQYAALYDVLATIPTIFGERYGLNTLEQGLCYMPIGFGAALAAIFNGRIMDWNYRRTAIKHGFPTNRKKTQDVRNFPIEEARLKAFVPVMVPGLLAMICYGWTLEHSPLPGPLVLQFIMGMTLTASFTMFTSMLIDLYPQGPASITAANNLTRCLFGAGATALIQPMINGMGLGWTYTFIGLVMTAMVPLVLLEGRMGPRWRAARYARQDAALARKRELEVSEGTAGESSRSEECKEGGKA